MKFEHETIDEITSEIRLSKDEYLQQLADRIDAAHTRGVILAMDELMGKD